jgi:hypothetical protein
MQDIVPIGGPVPQRAAPGTITRINRFEDLRAGTYWRAKDDVPELLKPQRRQRGIYLPKDHPDYIDRDDRWGQSETNRIGTEDYMVDVPVRSGLPAGRMHLVRSLKLADGEVHSVVLQGHPSEGERNTDRTYLVDEFLHYFEIVPEEEAQAIRQAEVAALQDEIGELQQAMIAGPPAEAPVALLGHQAKLPATPTVGTMIANIDHIEKLQSTAEQAVAIAKRQTDWIQTHTKEIAAKTAAMVPFYQERAAAALASTEAVMRYATDLQKGVQSLGLYIGTDVEVTRLVEGESAEPSERLHIHRDLMFLDEEYLVNLDQDRGRAGADHEDFDDFVERIKVDPSLRDRIFPFPRMVVLMRYRRSSRIYFEGEGIAAALANAEYNKPNRETFLLVRDGENLWKVYCELTTMQLRSLYPTKGMGDAPFRGVDGSSIGVNDLRFADAKTAFNDLNRVYRNLLILMWGLNDRLGMFGSFYPSSDWTPSGFLDEGFQHRYMRFWDPYEEATLGTGRPPFREWVRRMNGWLRSGSRVVVMRRTLAASGQLGRGNDMERVQSAAVRRIGDLALEMVARQTKKGHVVSVEAGRHVYGRGRFGQDRYLKQSYDVVLDETDHGYSENGTLSWLCLDMIEPSDIDHYLESRRDRRDYMEFYGLLLAVRDQLKLEAPQVEPLIAKLEAAYAEAPVPLPDGMTTRDLARQAIRLWRTSNRGAMPPAEGAEGHATAYKTMLAGMWTLAGNDHPVEAAETLAAEEGRQPLRLVLTGKERFALYTTSVGDELENRLFPHVWITRLACQRKGGALKVTSRKVMPMPDAVADEEILREWDALADWKGRDVSPIVNEPQYSDETRDPLTYEAIRKGFDAVALGTLEPFRTRPADIGLALARLNSRRRELTKTRSVADVYHVEPFAVIRTTTFKRRAVEGFTSRYELDAHDRDYLVLTLQDGAFRMLHRLCETDEERRMVIEAFASQYNDQQYQRHNFRESVGKPPMIGWTRLTDWAKAPADPLRRPRTWRSIPLEANWSENIRSFDVQRRIYEDSLWVPTTDQMVVWMDPSAPAILNDLCARFALEAVPFTPKAR